MMEATSWKRALLRVRTAAVDTAGGPARPGWR